MRVGHQHSRFHLNRTISVESSCVLSIFCQNRTISVESSCDLSIFYQNRTISVESSCDLSIFYQNRTISFESSCVLSRFYQNRTISVESSCDLSIFCQNRTISVESSCDLTVTIIEHRNPNFTWIRSLRFCKVRTPGGIVCCARLQARTIFIKQSQASIHFQNRKIQTYEKSSSLGYNLMKISFILITGIYVPLVLINS